MPKLTSHKYIVRFDYHNTRCWQFHFAPDGDWNQPYSRSFSDGVYGSKVQAFVAAISYRNRYLKRIGKLHLLEKFGSSIRLRHSLNKSGIIGVIRIVDYKQYGIYLGWKGYGMYEGSIWSRSFGINVYGEVAAFKLACKERYERHGTLSVLCNIKDLPANPGVPYKKQSTTVVHDTKERRN